jgi:hypothetical protein
MARYAETYSGERRTEALHVQLTPTERAQLEAAAHAAGSPSLSAFARDYLLRRTLAPRQVAGVRRHPDAPGLMYQLSAIGNNLNQLARVANRSGAVATVEELLAVIDMLKAAMARIIAL